MLRVAVAIVPTLLLPAPVAVPVVAAARGVSAADARGMPGRGAARAAVLVVLFVPLPVTAGRLADRARVVAPAADPGAG